MVKHITLRVILHTLCCLTLVFGRTLTWNQLGGGNLQSQANWDGGTIPTSEDDVIIRIQDTTAADHTIQSFYAANPWESSRDSYGSASSSNLLTLVEPWSVRSITVSGPASLVFDTQVRLSGALNIGHASTIFVKGGQLDAQSVDIGTGGTLSLDLAQVGSGHGSDMQIRAHDGGMILISSIGGSNHFTNVQLTLGNGAKAMWNAGPLILDSTSVMIENGGSFHANSDTLAQGDPHSSTSLKNSGLLVFNSTRLASGSQLCGVPLFNAPSGRILITGVVGVPSELRMLNSLKHDGLVTISGSRTLSLAYESADLNEGSKTMLDANATLWCQSGEAKMKGKVVAAEGVQEGGELLISALATQSGMIDINRLKLKGGVLATVDHSITTAREMLWHAGSMTGSGIINVGHSNAKDGSLRITEASSSKVLSGPQFNLYGSGVIEASNTLLMQSASQFHVASKSTLIHESLSQLQSGDDSPVQLKLDSEAQWIFHTLGSAGNRAQSIVSVPVISLGSLEVSGEGEVVFRQDSSFRTLQTKDLAGVRFQGLSNHTIFSFTDPISLPEEGQYLLLQSAHAELLSKEPSLIHGLAIMDGELSIHGPVEVDSLTLGSSTSSSHMIGPGPVNVKNVDFRSGILEVGRMDVSTELLISSAGAKSINLLNLTLLSGSVSRIQPSQTRVADTLHWWVQPNATLIIEGGASIYANRPSDHTGQPCLHVEGLVKFTGQPGSRSASTLEIMNRQRVEVVPQESTNPSSSAAAQQPYEALLTGGLTSLPSSTLAITQGAVLSSQCPQNLTSPFGCQIGVVEGSGQLALLFGTHTVLAPMDLTWLKLVNGVNEFYAPALVERMDMLDGELRLHGYMFVSSAAIHGGRLVGFPVLNSALVILPVATGTQGQTGADFTHNTTLSLDGLALICEGSCVARGADWVLQGDASLTVSRGGSMRFATPAIIHSGSAGAGSIINAGMMEFTTSGKEFLVRVPLLNRGSLLVKDRTDVAFESAVRQDAPLSSFYVERGSTVRKNDGGSLELETGSFRSEGPVYSHVQLGGRMEHRWGTPPAEIFGDVVLGVASSMSSMCASGNDCTAVQSNGTIYLNGLGNFSFASELASRDLSVMKASRIVGSFRETASGTQSGGAVYSMHYSPSSTSVTVTGMVDGAPTAHISPIYDSFLQQSISSVILPNLSPSPDGWNADSFASMEIDDPHAHHGGPGGHDSMMMHHTDPDDEPDSVLIARNSNSTLVTSQPIIIQERAANIDANVSHAGGGVFGLARSSGEGLLIALILLASVFVLMTVWLSHRFFRLKRQRRNQPQTPPPTGQVNNQPNTTAAASSTRTIEHPTNETNTDTSPTPPGSAPSSQPPNDNEEGRP